MKSFRSFVVLILFSTFSACFGAKENPKFMLPDVPPAQQWEYIDNLMREAQSRMANHDYSAAQSLLTERCELLDLYYATHGTGSVDAQKTGYEYMMLVPKLYCNLRTGHVESNLQEIAHLREQYQTLFNTRHLQDDLLETEVAETYFRMGNIGMAIETAEKLIQRLWVDKDYSSVAYQKMYYRLMAYYQSIGRKDTRYLGKYYVPENKITDTWELYCYLTDDSMTFQQKMTDIIENAAHLIAVDSDEKAREVIQLGMEILNAEYPPSTRKQDVAHRYNLMKVQLMTLQSQTYKYIFYANDEAEECLLDTYKLKKQLFGENSTEVADAAEALGNYYYEAADDFDQAIPLYKETYDILKSANEYRKGQLIDIMGTLMRCYAIIDDPQLVAEMAKELIVATKELVGTGFAVSSSAERAALWDKYNHWLLRDIPKLAHRFEGKIELGAELYDIALFSKGLLMMSDNAMTELVMKKGSPELKQEGRRLHELRLQLQEQLTSSQLSDILQVEDTRREIEDVEHRLVAQVNQLGNWQQELNLGWRDIQNRLKKGETAIEFLEYSNAFWERGDILAVILSADSYCPIMRYFCPSSDLVYSKTFEQCANTTFYDQIWSRIESDLRETSTLFFSPIGELNTIPIEYCPVDSTQSLFDKYNMYRLTSTRLILERSKPQPITSAYLYGGINYTPDLNNLQAANVSLMQEGYIAEGTSGLDKTMHFDTSVYCSNGITAQSDWMEIFTSTLSATALLTDFIGMMGCEVHPFYEFRATEECFKAMSRKPIDVLIVNTHGFTFSAGKTYTNRYSFTYKTYYNNVSSSELAMTLSGLLLSGASMAYAPDCDRNGLEDGIITAAEIALLNLQHVQLVHLSACNTGLGEITPEGVLGLQRGFKRAGAKAIISTLAPTYTTVAPYFDTTFYYNLLYAPNGKKRKTQSIHDAFYSSVKKLRDVHKDPKYWCVNVLIDALD